MFEALSNTPLQSDERQRRPLDRELMPRRRGLRPRLLAAVLRSRPPFGLRR
jgi:hypothetical protein